MEEITQKGLMSCIYQSIDKSIAEALVGYTSSVFNGDDGYDYSSYTLTDVLLSIKSDEYKDVTDKVRKENDKKKRQALKGDSLPAVRFSTTMTRSDSGEYVKSYTGVMGFDFDDVRVDSISISDFKKMLLQDENFRMVAVWTSSSGTGVRCLVECNIEKYRPENCTWSSEELYEFCCLNIVELFASRYGRYVKMVDSSKSRMDSPCFLSYDGGGIYITPVLLGKEPDEYWNRGVKEYKMSAFRDKKRVEECVASDGKIVKRQYEQAKKNIAHLIKKGIDVTYSYDNWYKLAFSLARTFREAGRHLFRGISSMYPTYSERECDKKFDAILNVVMNEHKKGGSNRNNIGFGTFCYIIKNEAGCLIPQGKSKKKKKGSKVNKKRNRRKEIQYQSNGKRVYVKHKEKTEKELAKEMIKNALFERLPCRFGQQQLEDIAELFCVSKSAIRGYITEEVRCENARIKRVRHGVYEKIVNVA